VLAALAPANLDHYPGRDAVHVVEAQRLRAIERAVAKSRKGPTDYPNFSADPIPKARLQAIPEAVRTIQEEEARERQRGDSIATVHRAILGLLYAFVQHG
jgi:RNA polymerase-binding transcription factor DksA